MKKTTAIIKKALLLLCNLLIIIVAVSYFSPIYKFEAPAPFEGPDVYNPYLGIDTCLMWKRANFHTHTRVEGPLNECELGPDSVYLDYKKLGYDIVAFSNHNKITSHPYDDSLQIKVYEHGYNIGKFHKLVFGADKVNYFDAPFLLFSSQKQFQIDFLGKKADFIVLNHPERTVKITKRNMDRLTGYHFMEGDSGISTDLLHWDRALSAGHYSFIMTNDDCHDSRNMEKIGVRCNFLNTPSCKYPDIKESLLSGRFYAMRVPSELKNVNLPYIKSIGTRNDTVYMELSEKAAEIKVTGQYRVERASVQDTSAVQYAMSVNDPYIRLTAYFADGSVIYSQPFARYYKKTADSPYRENPHEIMILATLLYCMLLIIIIAISLFNIIRLFSDEKAEA